MVLKQAVCARNLTLCGRVLQSCGPTETRVLDLKDRLAGHNIGLQGITPNIHSTLFCHDKIGDAVGD
jgi:hypothetical protein